MMFKIGEVNILTEGIKTHSGKRGLDNEKSNTVFVLVLLAYML